MCCNSYVCLSAVNYIVYQIMSYITLCIVNYWYIYCIHMTDSFFTIEIKQCCISVNIHTCRFTYVI